ncbi:MAG: ParB/RepB/Spo0J family partition protein [Nitrospiria bacterium]
MSEKSKKRKSFGISKQLKQGLEETFSVVRNNRNELRYEIVPLARIEVDPDNPRELSISPQEVQNGLSNGDPLFKVKKEELEGLKRMGETIQKNGLINAISVYKHGDQYRVIAGERRYLSCLLIGKQDIQTRIYGNRPVEEDLRTIQWIENNEREDLALKDRIGNIRAIIESIQAKQPELKMTATLLKELLSVSTPQASNYLAIIKAPMDVKEKIDSGTINSIEKGALLSKVKDREIRADLIVECESGSSLKKLNEMMKLLEDAKREKKRGGKSSKNRVGKPLSRVNLGGTKSPRVVEKLIGLVVQQPEYKKYAQIFDAVDWQDLNETSLAFRKLLDLLEAENEN